MRQTMKWLLLFNATTAYVLVSIWRFIATIVVGEEQALAAGQSAMSEFMQEHDGLAVLRRFEAPISITLPDPIETAAPRPINARPITAASVASMPILFEAGPYKLIRQTPPNESCPYWIYDFTGPGFERTSMGGFAFIGCTESCGQSHMGALARAFAAGHASPPARVEDSCQTR